MPATGEIFQMTYQQQLDGQTMETVLHFREITPNTADADIAASADKWWSLTKDVQSSDVSYTQVIVKKMTPIPFDEQLNPPISAIQGTVGGGPVNNTLAVILTKRTGVAGKSHRGRIYIGGSSTQDSNANLLNVNGITRFTTFIASIMTTFGPAGTDTHLQLGVYSRSIGGSAPFTVAGWQPVTKLDLQTVLGNQRRRRFGVGM